MVTSAILLIIIGIAMNKLFKEFPLKVSSSDPCIRKMEICIYTAWLLERSDKKYWKKIKKMVIDHHSKSKEEAKELRKAFMKVEKVSIKRIKKSKNRMKKLKNKRDKRT